MNHPVSWSEFLRAVELTELKIAAIYGYIAQVDPGEGVEPLPGEWDLGIQQGHRADGHELMVRVIANASGPGGRLTVDGMGTFESTLPLDTVPTEVLDRFVEQTGVPAVIPTVRASFNDMNLRMELGAPRLGLLKLRVDPISNKSD